MTNTLFDLSNKTAFITGGAGLLGPKHAEAVIENCLPIKSLPKPPKKKTATTTAS